MVLNNDGRLGFDSSVVGDFNEVIQLNPLDQPLQMQHGQQPAVSVSHISSNGYYGFSYVNAADPNNNTCNNNNMTSSDNNNNDNSNYNNTLLPTNCVNDKTACMQAAIDDFVRSKKRVHVNTGNVIAKRCRFDQHDNAVAEYCNDFFSLPTNQIGTQSCLMETEDMEIVNSRHQEQLQSLEVHQQQQQQNHLQQHQQQQHQHQQHQHQQHQHQQHQQIHQQKEQQHHHYQVDRDSGPFLQGSCPNTQSNFQFFPQQQQQQQQTQQHYAPQGHIQRPNRDVSRCLSSHMI